MLRQALRPSALLLLVALPALSRAAAHAAQVQDASLQPLAQALWAYREARALGQGVEDALVGLRAVLATQRELLEGRDPLRDPHAVGRAEWLSWPRAAFKKERGQVVDANYVGGSFAADGLAYAYRLPKDYDPSQKSYPLVLSLPDEKESPAAHLREQWLAREYLEQAILFCPAMPKQREEWDQVVVAGRPGGLSHVLTAYRLASEQFAVDVDRVYVVGRGKAVPAAIAAGNYAPQRFAGIAGRAGDAGAVGPENFSNLPTFFAGGGANATAFQKAAREAGHDNCTLQAAADESELWRWMQQQTRASAPNRLKIVVGKPFPTRVYWLRVAPTTMDTQAVASIDRTTNTIEIQCQGTSHIALFLNDALVDLDLPLKIVCNGVSSSARVRRSLPVTLTLLDEGISDAGALFVAQHIVELSPDNQATVGVGELAPDVELEQRFQAAGEAPVALYDLYLWCQANQRGERAPGILRKLLRYAPDHAEARAALGYVRAGEQWFESQAALERYLQCQDEATAKSRGLVKQQALWVHPDDRAYMNKGLVKDQASGQWLSPADRKRLQEGWLRQDLHWIPPAEAARADLGLWWVDGEWLDLPSANRRRSAMQHMWRIPSRELLVHSTADREVALRAREEMLRALDDLRLVFGAEPPLPLAVAVLRDEEQYDRFAFGDPDGRRAPTHVGRLHIVHSAYFAESWFERVDRRFEFSGMGVCYWDAEAPNGDLYGTHAARLAVGLSYVDALDPSPKVVRKSQADGPALDYYAAYQAEKKLPAWLRYGGAVYAERYFQDRRVATDGDPWWARKWSLDNLRQRGGLRSLPDVLACALNPDDRDDGLKLLIECGLLVAFMVDGACEPVSTAHAKLKQALALGRLHPNLITALEEELLAHEAQLKAFAGL